MSEMIDRSWTYIPKTLRNDRDGHLKAAALQASATFWASPTDEDGAPATAADVLGTAEAFYEWLREP